MAEIMKTPAGARFHWVTNGEPHAMRRREILSKYGSEIRQLYGYDHKTAWEVMSVVISQFIMAYLVQDWAWWKLWVVAYVISGTLNQNLFCAQHEISHCLAFRKPLYNKILALVANTPQVVPVAVKFREYHHDHHLFLGVDGGDVDLPTVLESTWITNTLTKSIYGFFYLVVYGVRPLMVRPKAANSGDAVNWAIVMTSNLLVLHFWGFKSLVYLLAGSILGGGLHPLAGHLIAEHYMFEKGQETYSYYGPLNALSYNVGYHNEHHDFPQIPQTRLYRLRQIAPEFYEPLYHHTSWCWVIWKFLTDPTVGPWSRMHREQRDGTADGNAKYIAGKCRYGTDLTAEGGVAAAAAEGVTAGGAGVAVAPITIVGDTEKSGVLAPRQPSMRASATAKGGNGKILTHVRNDSAVENMPMN